MTNRLKGAADALILGAALLALPLGAPGRATPAPRDLVVRAAQTMGGEAALRSIATVSWRFTTTNFGLGQEETWASPPRPSLAVGQTIVDHAKGRRATTQEVRPAATPSGANTLRQIIGPDYGVNETNGNAAAMGGGAVRGAQRTTRDYPERLVLFALDNAASVRAIGTRRFREEEYDGIRVTQGSDSTDLYFDRVTGRPVLTVVTTDDAVLGDRTTEALYGRWTPTGSVMLPRQVDVFANGRMISTTQVSTAEVNGTVDETLFGADGALIAQSRSQANVTPAPLSVVLTQLGPGVWRAEGSTHHTLVIEQGDGLLLVETPQSAARMRAVFDTLAKRFPGKRVTQAVNTHHHYDHSGGVRETLARGIPFLTHARNVAFIEKVGAASKTVAPDALSRGGRRPAVRAVTDTMVVGSGASMVVLYPIASVHVDGILAAYVPSTGTLFTSDVVNPPAAPNPNAVLNPAGAAELVAFAKARGLAPKVYAGGHGHTLTWAEVERAATPSR